MKQIAVIAPIPHLCDFEKYSDIDMVLLPYLLSSAEYYNFFKNSRRYKILDNGTFETGRSSTFEQLIEKAKEINANELILPDIRDKANATIKLAEDSLSIMSRTDRRRFKVMVVCQAKTPNQQIRRYPEYASLPVDVLGIMRPLHRQVIDRSVTVRWLQVSGKWDKTKEHHFLGLDDPVELKLINGIRSTDTTWPIRYGYVGKYIHLAMSTPKWLLPHMDFEEMLEPAVLERAKFNCEVLREYAR